MNVVDLSGNEGDDKGILSVFERLVFDFLLNRAAPLRRVHVTYVDVLSCSHSFRVGLKGGQIREVVDFHIDAEEFFVFLQIREGQLEDGIGANRSVVPFLITMACAASHSVMRVVGREPALRRLPREGAVFVDKDFASVFFPENFLHIRRVEGLDVFEEGSFSALHPQFEMVAFGTGVQQDLVALEVVQFNVFHSESVGSGRYDSARTC